MITKPPLPKCVITLEYRNRLYKLEEILGKRIGNNVLIIYKPISRPRFNMMKLIKH